MTYSFFFTFLHAIFPLSWDWDNKGYDCFCQTSGLSMNILCAGNKSPVQRDFSKNGAGDLLSALRFLGGVYNFCNFVIERSTLVGQHSAKSLLFSLM